MCGVHVNARTGKGKERKAAADMTLALQVGVTFLCNVRLFQIFLENLRWVNSRTIIVCISSNGYITAAFIFYNFVYQM